MRYSNESDGKMTKSLVGGSESKSKKNTRPPSGFPEAELKRETLLNKEFNPLEDPSESIHRSSKYSRRSLGSVKYQYSICGLTENELISVGINDRHILIKITNIHLSPNPAALKK